jgi:hypothetical protein
VSGPHYTLQAQTQPPYAARDGNKRNNDREAGPRQKSSQQRGKKKGGRKKGGKRGKGKGKSRRSAGRQMVRAWELPIVQNVLRWKKVYGSPEFVRHILNTYLRRGRRRAGPANRGAQPGGALPERCADCPVAALE